MPINVAAITGASLVTGLLFAFSNFVMRALAELPPDKGMFTMNQINEKIINPIFLLFFLGTPVLCMFIAVTAVMHMSEPGNGYLLAGALAYLAGPLAITIMFNVPLNNLLAQTSESEADAIWPMYQKKWQRWNHIRTTIGLASIILMATGLGTN